MRKISSYIHTVVNIAEKGRATRSRDARRQDITADYRYHLSSRRYFQ